jgi:serine/threonine protein kinase
LGKDLEDTQELPAHYTETVIRIDTVDADELPAGTRVGSFVVHSKIASGGGGTVYLAKACDPGAERQEVAIKVLLRELAASPQALARFQREAEVLKMISHPNIVSVVESGGLPDGRPYIVMELVIGENLRAMLRRRGRLSPEEMMQIIEPTSSALIAAHSAGVIHRDLKASNISVGGSAEQPVIKLLDFGIAKLTQADSAIPGLTVKGSRLGTPYAMAPEQIRGDAVDGRADIYSLGVLAYQMLTGNYPFSAASAHEIERLHLDAVPPRPSRLAPVSPPLEAVIIRCLEKKPEARFATVAEFLAELRRAVGGAPPDTESDERQAVAVAVELHIDLEQADSDELLDDTQVVLDLAEESLRAAGFDLPLVTGTLILGTRFLLPGEAGRETRQDALSLARALAEQVRGRDGAHPGVAAVISLHAGPAVVRGAQIVGGPLLDPAQWPLVTELGGVRATATAAQDLAT